MDTSKTAYTWNEMLMVPVEELPARSRVPIEIFDDPKDMFYQLARRVVDTVKSNNEKGLKTRIAWPVGPKKNYPLMVEMSIITFVDQFSQTIVPRTPAQAAEYEKSPSIVYSTIFAKLAKRNPLPPRF